MFMIYDLKDYILGNDDDEPDDANENDPSEPEKSEEETAVSPKTEMKLSKEELRQKRLESLSMRSSASSSSTNKPDGDERPKSPISSEKKDVTVVSSPTKISNPSKSPSKTVQSPTSKKVPRKVASISNDVPTVSIEVMKEIWVDRILSTLLKVTLFEEKASGGYTFLQGILEASHGDEKRSLSLRMIDIDSIILERLSLGFESHTSAFEYLVNVYNSTYNILQSKEFQIATVTKETKCKFPDMKQTEQVNYCTKSLELLCSSLVNFSGMTLLENDMFEDIERKNSLLSFQKLIQTDPKIGRALSDVYMCAFVNSFDTDGLEEIITNVIPLILQINATQLDGAMKRLHALTRLASASSTAIHVIVKHPSFLPDSAVNGRQFEQMSLLGPLFSHSVSSPDQILKINTQLDSKFITKLQVMTLKESFAHASAVYQRDLYLLFKMFLKDKQNKKIAMKWLSTVCSLNKAKRRTHFAPHTVASNSFFINISQLMLFLAQPLLDTKKNRMQTIDLRYLVANGNYAIDYECVTRMSAKDSEVKALQPLVIADKKELEYNFVTEIFFLTCEILHLGTVHHLQSLRHIHKKLYEIQQSINSIDSTSDMGRRMLEQQTKIQIQLRGNEIAYNADIMGDRASVDRLVAFYNATASLIVNKYGTVDDLLLSIFNKNNNNNDVTMDSLHRLFPEHILEDIVDVIGSFSKMEEGFLNTYAYTSERLSPNGKIGGILMYILVCIAGKTSNPGLRLKGLEVLVSFFTNQETDDPSNISSDHIFNTHPYLQKALIPSLLKLYIDVGTCHLHIKYVTRREISGFFRILWGMPKYKNSLINESKDVDHFGLFTNAIANDMIFVLDEALRYLGEVHTYEVYKDTNEYKNTTPQEKHEKLMAFKQSQGACKFYMTSANVQVHMFYFLTQYIKEPFLCSEFVSRMAEIITYFFSKMVGNSIGDYKVQNPEQYEFKPRTLLKELIGTMLNLTVSSSSSSLNEEKTSDSSANQSEQFLEAIVEYHTYNPILFRNGFRKVQRKQILNNRDETAFENILNRMEELYQKCEEMEDDDAPDEFLDALMQHVMKDPVLLPSSKVYLDRSTIRRHLMNKETDPFDRSSLTIEQVIPQPELKARIEEWQAMKKKK